MRRSGTTRFGWLAHANIEPETLKRSKPANASGANGVRTVSRAAGSVAAATLAGTHGNEFERVELRMLLRLVRWTQPRSGGVFGPRLCAQRQSQQDVKVVTLFRA